MHITYTLALFAGLSLASTALAKGSYSYDNQGIFSHTNQDGPHERSLDHEPPIDVWLAAPLHDDKKSMKSLADPLFMAQLLGAPHFSAASVLSLAVPHDITSNAAVFSQASAMQALALGFDMSSSQSMHTPAQLPSTVPAPAAIAVLGFGAAFGGRRRRRPS